MTMFKTKEEISEKFYKWFSSTGYFPHAQGISDVAYIEAYTQAQQDIKEACSEGFEEAFNKVNVYEGYELAQKQLWQAAKLSSEKIIQEKDQKVAELEEKYDKAVKDIKYLLGTINNLLPDIRDCADEDETEEFEEVTKEIRKRHGISEE